MTLKTNESHDEFYFWLSRLSGAVFEDLCCDLLCWENKGNIAERFGRSGQKQFGVDIVVYNAGLDSLTAMECKRVSAIDCNIISEAIGRFWSYKQSWISRGVRSFILAFSGQLDDVGCIDLLLEKATEFKSVGVAFEYWSARTIRNKLAQIPYLERRYQAGDGRAIADSDFISLGNTRKRRERGDRTSTRLLESVRYSHLGQVLSVIQEGRSLDEILSLEDSLVETASKTSFSPGDIASGLSLTKSLGENRLFMQDWRLRRVLGKAINKLLADCPEGFPEDRVIGDLAESFLDASPRSIALSIGATGSLAAANRLGLHWIKGLINHSHPQVRWNIAKRWNLLRPLIEGLFAKEDLPQLTDVWIRRRFLLSIMQSQDIIESRLLGIVSKAAELEASAVRGPAFIRAANDWLRLHSGMTLPGIDTRPTFEVGQEVSFMLYRLGEAREDKDLYDFSAYLDYRCVSLDYELSRGASEIAGRSTGEGRYQIIRRWVREALENTKSQLRHRLIQYLLECADEGIRWAVAAQPQLWMSQVDSGALSEIIDKLLSDEHPWVVKETIGELAREAPPSRIDAYKVISHANSSVRSAVNEGWALEEFSSSLLRLIANYPELAADNIESSWKVRESVRGS